MARWYDEVYADQVRYGLRTTGTLFSRQSEFQRVEVIETDRLGRVLVIDGVFMTDESEEFYYHEMLVHPALVTAPKVSSVLIIGGGDGGTAREVLRHRDVEHVVMVEIDAVVIEASKRFLPRLGAWTDPRLNVVIGDGIEYVRKAAAGSFDVVLLDGTDPVGPARGLFTAEFYANARALLSERGVFAAQTESPILMPEVWHEINAALRATFEHVHPYFGPVPLYAAGTWSWTHCSDGANHLTVNPARLESVERGCKYYNRGIHAAAFALPNSLRR